MNSARSYNLQYVLSLGATAALGGLLFGFDIAIITGAGPFLETHFHLDEFALGGAFSSLLFGCVVGSAASGFIAERFGRRTPLMWLAGLFAITSVATGVSTSFGLFIAARFAGGLAVGGISVFAPMYVAEVSPAAIRGRMGTLYQLAITLGVLLSYGINYALHDAGAANWRWMFISGVAPSVVFFLLLHRAPESPRFLVKVARVPEALAVLTRVSGPEVASTELMQIEASLTTARGTWRTLLQPKMRRAVSAGLGLSVLIHLSGINTIIDYAPRIFQSAGWSIDAALISTFIIGTTNFLLTLVSLWVIDRFGRKPPYVVGSLGMVATTICLTVAAASGHFVGATVLVFILAYLAFFASCIGPVFWTLLPEMFPNRIRGEAMSAAVLTQWLANALVVLLFPWVFAKMGQSPTFGFLAVMSLLQAAFMWRLVPETKGRSLEEIERFWVGRDESSGRQVSP